VRMFILFFWLHPPLISREQIDTHTHQLCCSMSLLRNLHHHELQITGRGIDPLSARNTTLLELCRKLSIAEQDLLHGRHWHSSFVWWWLLFSTLVPPNNFCLCFCARLPPFEREAIWLFFDHGLHVSLPSLLNSGIFCQGFLSFGLKFFIQSLSFQSFGFFPNPRQWILSSLCHWRPMWFSKRRISNYKQPCTPTLFAFSQISLSSSSSKPHFQSVCLKHTHTHSRFFHNLPQAGYGSLRLYM